MTEFTLDGRPPHQRDPRTAPWGLYLAWSMGSGGEQGFHWFHREQEALAFLVELDEVLFPFESEDDGNASASPLQRFAESAHRLDDLPLQAVNDAQAVVQFRWAGRFESLIVEPSRFAREVRRDFYDVYEGGFRSDLHDTHMLTAFVEHLGNYIRRYPETRYVSPYSLNRA